MNTLYWRRAEFDVKPSGSYSGHCACSKLHTGSCNHWPLKWPLQLGQLGTSPWFTAVHVCILVASTVAWNVDYPE